MDVKKQNLLKNTLILVIGKFCTQFINFILLPIYTFYLNTGEYGLVDLLTTYISLLVPILTLQLEMGVFRFLIDFRKNEKEKTIIITNSFFLLLIMSAFTVFVGILIIDTFNIKYGVYIILMILATIFSNNLLQLSRGLGENINYSIGCSIAAFFNILINILLLIFLHCGIKSVFIATIISNCICSVFLFFKNKVYHYIHRYSLNKKFIFDLLAYSYPLVPNGLVWWVINASDRTIISMILGVSENGIYSVSNKFSNIINSIYSIFNMSWTESVSLHINDGDGYLKEMLNSMFNFISMMCALLISSMFLIFPLLINSNFADSYIHIPILIISSLFNMLSANIGALYIAKKETKAIAKTTILASIINILFNLFLIKRIKLFAASISTLIAFCILFFIRYFDIKKNTDICLNVKDVMINSLILCIAFIIYYLSSKYIKILFLGLLVIYILIKYKTIILNIFKR